MRHAWVLVAACAVWTGPARGDLFSASGPVIAIMGDELFTGIAVGHLSGAGTLTIGSSGGTVCSGRFTSSALLGGLGQLSCSDGSTATFHFLRLSITQGYGSGTATRGALSFTYGLSPEQSGLYLRLPVGKALVQDGRGLRLGDK